MLKQLIAQSLNGFSSKDLPFLFLQLSVSALLAVLIRYYWRKGTEDTQELNLLKYLLPVQMVLTVIAIFSLKSPWMIVLFGFIAMIPVIGSHSPGIRAKVFYLLCVFIAFGCGVSNLVVTTLVTVLLVLPVLHFAKSEK
jgi:hypothetical protein